MQTSYNQAQLGPLLEEVPLMVALLSLGFNLTEDPTSYPGTKAPNQGTDLTQKEHQASNASPAAFPERL